MGLSFIIMKLNVDFSNLYRDITPKSQVGRAVLTPFALCLIPLATVSVVILERILAAAIKLLVILVEEHILRRKRIQWFQRKFITIQVCACASFLCLNAYYYYKTFFSNHTYLDNVYFTFVTMSTIGFGDMVVRSNFVRNSSLAMQVFVSTVDLVIFYINFTSQASIIGSITSAKTNHPDDDGGDDGDGGGGVDGVSDGDDDKIKSIDRTFIEVKSISKHGFFNKNTLI